MSSLPRYRIFISSPRDVGSERALAMRALERLQLEFRGRVELSPVFWEHEVLKATDTFQSQIPRAADADLCVFILWSWFGTPLPEDFRRPDGSTYQSGTEFEFEDAITGFRQKGSPDVLVYRKTADVAMPTRDRARELEWRAQRDALHDFIDRWFRGEGGTFKAAFHEFDKQQQFEDLFENHLRRWIESRLRAADPADGARPEAGIWQGSPYRGLERFDFDHALIFCGRTQAVSEAIDALRRLNDRGTPFLLVVGQSGAGKSSFVRAGVVPMLIQPRVIEGHIAWRWAAMRPGDVPGEPLESMATALLADGALPELAEGGITRSELAAMLAGRTEAVLPMLSMALARAASTRAGAPAASARLVLIVDQLDEIFTQSAITPDQRAAFAQALAALARSGKVWVIATLRSDLFARMAELPAAFNELARGDGFYELRAPSAAEIGQMIRRPARIAGVSFERRTDTDESLDDVLRDAAAAQPASLPLLQFALDELSKTCAATKLLTFAAYDTLGGLEGALRARAEATFTGLGELAKAALSPVIARLVEVRLDGAVGQTRARKAALDAIAGGSELVDAFVAARLLVVDRGADGDAVVGVAHEALLREWPRVRDWIEENRAFLNARARIAAAQTLWSAAERGDANLLPQGRLLAEGTNLLEARRELLSEAEAEFIAASLRRAARERRGRRLRWAAAAALVLLVGGAGIAYWDAYVREHVAYYRNFTKLWGVFVGRDLINEDELRARQRSYRFFTRGRLGFVYRMEAVNGSGSCPQVGPLSLYIGGDLSVRDYTSKRPCSWEFETDANGHARAEHGFDFTGRAVYSFRYSDKDGTTAEYYTADGYASSGASSGASRVVFERVQSGALAGLDTMMRFKDAYGRPKPNHQRVYGNRQEYDERGRIVRVIHLDRDDQPTTDPDGAAGTENQYNTRDEVVAWINLDVNGKPTTGRNGFASIKVDYDAVGNQTRFATFDVDGKPALRAEGYAELRQSYDKNGNIVLFEYFDTQGRPTRSKSGESKIRRTSDERGWLREIVFLDEDGKPILTTRGPRASFRNEYDAESNIVRVTSFDLKGSPTQQVVTGYADGLLVREAYLDMSGKPSPRVDGYSAIAMSYRNGLEAERTYLDARDRPVRTRLGYAKRKTSYDERANAIEVAYLDEDGKPALGDQGYAKVKRRFSEFGDAEEEVFLGTDDAPKRLAAGYAKLRRVHDAHGRAIETRYLDEADRPVAPANDCSFRRTYDIWGRATTTLCIDQNGAPVRHPDGWTRREVAYDPVGNPVGEFYFDAAGAPVRDKNGIGRFQRSYDAWGNLIGVAYRDERGAATKWTNGCYRSTWRFNRRNNVIEETCLGADGEPAERNDGPHRVTVERDEQDRVTLRIFTALRIKSGWPTRTIREYLDEQGRFRRAEFVDDNGVVRQARDVDERGRTLVMAYFDEQGRPMLGPGGFAKSKVLAYDEFGGADMVFEDEHGAPVEPAILVKGVKEGGAGARAGLRVNDVILRYGGRDIHYGTLAAAQRAPGQEPRELVVLRGNNLETLQVEPGALQIEIEPVPRPKA